MKLLEFLNIGTCHMATCPSLRCLVCHLCTEDVTLLLSLGRSSLTWEKGYEGIKHLMTNISRAYATPLQTLVPNIILGVQRMEKKYVWLN